MFLEQAGIYWLFVSKCFFLISYICLFEEMTYCFWCFYELVSYSVSSRWGHFICKDLVTAAFKGGYRLSAGDTCNVNPVNQQGENVRVDFFLPAWLLWQLVANMQKKKHVMGSKDESCAQISAVQGNGGCSMCVHYTIWILKWENLTIRAKFMWTSHGHSYITCTSKH